MVDGPKTEKEREPAVEIESGAWNLEAEGIRSRAESTGGCVKLKTVTEIRRSNVPDIFITESVYLVLVYLWHWEPVERLKHVSPSPPPPPFFFFFFLGGGGGRDSHRDKSQRRD